MFITILRTGLLIFLLNDYLKNKYPERYQNLIVSISYNFFYLFSKVQILFKKFATNMNEKIEGNPNLLKIKNQILLLMNLKPDMLEMTEYIKNGEYIESLQGDDIDFDFLLYSWPEDDSECVNKKIVYNKNEIISCSDISKIKFILIEIKFGENSYKINLKTEKYNFYIAGNVFTKQFFIYYLKQFLKLNEDVNSDDKISIKIIDQNVNIIEFEFTDKNENIILENNSYKISNCK